MSTTQRRSFPFIVFPSRETQKKIRPWLIAATLLLFGVLVAMTPPAGLSNEGLNALALFVLCLIFWVTNAIPLMITSLLAVILLPILGILDAKEAYALFGNQAVFFILGAFILASALMRSGLSMRIALLVLKRFNKNQRSLLLGILLLPAALSFVMSEHAVAAMMFPIVYEIAKAMKLKEGSRYGTALFLAMAWGCIIGGIATFLGGARAILAVGILEETTGQTVGFLEWMLAALPTVIVLLIVAGGVLFWITRRERHTVHEATVLLQEKVQAMGTVSQREKAIGALMILTIIGWVAGGHQFGIANIALGAVVVAFMFKLLRWKQVEEDVNWGIILMYGGAIALGSALDQSGAVEWVAQQVIGNWIATPIVLILVLCILAELLTEAMSNSAVIALMMPMALVLAHQFGVDPRVATMSLAIPSGLAFMLPMSTPAVAIAVSSGYVKTVDTARFGVLLNIVSIITFIIVAMVYWPLIGFAV